jgi:HlyD family secretion protein
VKKLLLVVILIALGLAGVAYYTQWRHTHSNGDAYIIMKVGFGEMRDNVSGTARLKPIDMRAIMSEIPGQIVDLPGEIGKVVEEGQLLVQFDQRDAKIKRAKAAAAVEAAEAVITAAKSKLDEAIAGRNAAQDGLDATKGIVIGRVDRARLQGAVNLAEKKIKEAESGVTVANSQRDLAKANLAEADHGLKLTAIRVPSDADTDGELKQPDILGVRFYPAEEQPKRRFTVLDRRVELGQNVDTKQLLFVLAADLGEMEAHALIPESQITRVAPGQKAEFWVDALGDEKKMPAKVTEIREVPASQGVQEAVSYEVVLKVKNVKNKKTGQWQLKSGMTAQVEITDRIHRDVWKLPVNARSFTLEEQNQTAEAKKAVADGEKRLDMDTWSKIWILRDGKPWPVFVRLSGVGAHGETGIKDAEHHEILEWDAQTKPEGLNPKDSKTFPEVIIGAPPKKNGLFDFKFSL